MTKRKRTIDKTIDKMGDDLAIESLQHAQMNQTRDYVERGRGLEQHTDEELKAVWAATFEKHFAEPTKESARNMNDAAAELRLRNIDLPVERVQETFDAIQAALREAGPDAFEGLDEENAAFLAARAKPKN
jgi:hypothetical protein